MNHFACRRRGGASGDPRPSSLLKKDKACNRSNRTSAHSRSGVSKPQSVAEKACKSSRSVARKEVVDGDFTTVQDTAETTLFFTSFGSEASTGQSLVARADSR